MPTSINCAHLDVPAIFIGLATVEARCFKSRSGAARIYRDAAGHDVIRDVGGVLKMVR